MCIISLSPPQSSSPLTCRLHHPYQKTKMWQQSPSLSSTYFIGIRDLLAKCLLGQENSSCGSNLHRDTLHPIPLYLSSVYPFE